MSRVISTRLPSRTGTTAGPVRTWEADLVFAGGTLAPVGGHNLVEPVQAGRVVVHGPHLENQRSQARLLEPLGVLHRIDGAAQLSETLRLLWADPQRNLAVAMVLNSGTGTPFGDLRIVHIGSAAARCADRR